MWATPYPPADFFFLVTSASLWYSGEFGKISEAPRPARYRMTVLFSRFQARSVSNIAPKVEVGVRV